MLEQPSVFSIFLTLQVCLTTPRMQGYLVFEFQPYQPILIVFTHYFCQACIEGGPGGCPGSA